MKGNHKKYTEKTIQKKQKLKTEVNLNNVEGRKVNRYGVHQKFGLIDKFKLKVFDQILDICYLEYREEIEKEIENLESNCTDGVTN